ncbi:type III secretion system cytoplasmic ring protein SctQ [Trinickia dinghuensis]|uniref:type III secretion system cytoplasmic ring protein SctQ n=1 Tax=Trinickia dinghuensis TaxID=2291023 RepID=UPI0015F14300|nr:type III secretion system cytoplasmic ring protein SctQ [Trinickia dinghuensis]
MADGVQADLLIREDLGPAGDHDEGLPLSTRFGPAIAYHYAPLLLACTGVDVMQGAGPSAQTALARYAIAALDPALQTALGDPTVSDSDSEATSLRRESPFALNVQIRLPSIRLAMRLVMTATGVQALLDGEPWQPDCASLPPPAWLTGLDAGIRLVVGESTLPLAQCNALACGDIVRLAVGAFDVAGRGSVRTGSHRLLLRWGDSHRCFEVEHMTHDPSLSPNDMDAAPARGAIGPADGIAPIDTAAIPVRLSFSLGTLRLTVGDVAALRSGSLVELKDGLPPKVSIEANGLPIGAGELVDFDGRLAVEITQWPQAHVPSSTS